MTGWRRLVTGTAAWLLASAAPAQESPPVPPVPPEVLQALDGLRAQWPEVARAEIRNGSRFEFRDGTLLLGSDRLVKLAALPGNAHGEILSFLLGHEAWHSVQYKRRSAAEIQQMKSNRMLECEADFMGAAAAYRAMAKLGLSTETLRAARLAIARYVGEQTRRAAATTAYPSDQLRAATIAIGWRQAQDPGLIHDPEGRAVPQSEDQRASMICRLVANAGDSSIGNVEIHWERPPFDPADLSGVSSQVATLENKSLRPVTLSFAALDKRRVGPWRSDAGDDDMYDLFGVTVDTVTIPAKQTIRRTYTFPTRVGTDTSSFVYTEVPSHIGGAPFSWGPYFTLAASDYADPPTRIRYCMDQLARGETPRERAMLARLGSIAISAEDDFRAIASAETYDDDNGKIVRIRPVFAFSGSDNIYVGSRGATAYFTLFENTDEAAAKAEYQRLVGMFRHVCGAPAVALLPLGRDQQPGEEDFNLVSFAPRAEIRLALSLDSRYASPPSADAPPRTRGTIRLTVNRTPGF